MKSFQYSNITIWQYNNKKGVSLIIVIFAMMLFAVLGWTLTVMQSGDFEVNLRNLDSERALGLAEAGAQWALNHLVNNPDESRPWDPPYVHTLGFGQYSVTCADGQVGTEEEGRLVITSTGFIPTQASYRAMRVVRLVVSIGAIDRAINCRYLFDWSGGRSLFSFIIGPVGVTDRSDIPGDPFTTGDGYEGNGVLPHNQDPQDVHNQDPVNPPLWGARNRLPDDSGYPKIDMEYMESEADRRNSSWVWAPTRAGEITAVRLADGDTRTELDLDISIFSTPLDQWDNQALRNTSKGSWQSGNWKEIYTAIDANTVKLDGVADWSVGDRVCLVPKIFNIAVDVPNKRYTIDFDCDFFTTPFNQWENQVMRNFSRGTWAYSDWGVITSVPNARRAIVQIDTSVDLNYQVGGEYIYRWKINEWVGIVRRFTGNNNNQVWYLKGDMLYDLRSTAANCMKSTFVAEGDIALIGTRSLTITAHNNRSANETFPCVASKNGDIFSNSGSYFLFRRNFLGLVYSETGDIYFDNITGVSVYGYNITFVGLFQLDYGYFTSRWVDEDAFFATISSFTWQEQ